MRAQTDNLVTPAGPRTGRRNAGIILVGMGLFLFLGQLLPEHTLGLMVLPLLGGIFLVAAVLTRNVGFLVPGGILTGLGVGVMLVEQPWLIVPGTYKFIETAEAGVLLLSMAAGFGLVSVLSPFVGRRFHVWPLFPTAILATIGGLMLSGDEGIRLLVEYGKYWPIILVVLGGLMLFRRSD